MTQYRDELTRTLRRDRTLIATQAVREGWTVQQAAHAMGLRDAASMYRWTYRAGVDHEEIWKTLRDRGREYYAMTPEQKANRIEDLEWLIQFGVTIEEAARRVGMPTANSLDRWLHREGRPDLARALTAYQWEYKHRHELTVTR